MRHYLVRTSSAIASSAWQSMNTIADWALENYNGKDVKKTQCFHFLAKDGAVGKSVCCVVWLIWAAAKKRTEGGKYIIAMGTEREAHNRTAQVKPFE